MCCEPGRFAVRRGQCSDAPLGGRSSNWQSTLAELKSTLDHLMLHENLLHSQHRARASRSRTPWQNLGPNSPHGGPFFSLSRGSRGRVRVSRFTSLACTAQCKGRRQESWAWSCQSAPGTCGRSLAAGVQRWLRPIQNPRSIIRIPHGVLSQRRDGRALQGGLQRRDLSWQQKRQGRIQTFAARGGSGNRLPGLDA